MNVSHTKCTTCVVNVKEEIDLQLKECGSPQEGKKLSKRDFVMKSCAQKEINDLASNSEAAKLLTRSLTTAVPALPAKRKRNCDKVSVSAASTTAVPTPPAKRNRNCDKISVSAVPTNEWHTGRTQVSYYIIKPIIKPVQESFDNRGVNDQQTKTQYLCTHLETKLVDSNPTSDASKTTPVRTVLDESNSNTENITVFKVNHDHPYAVKRSGKTCVSKKVLDRLKLLRFKKDHTKEEEIRCKHRERQRRYRAKQKQKRDQLQKLFNKEECLKEGVNFVHFQAKNGTQAQPCRYEHIMDEVGVLHRPASSSSCKQSRLHVIQNTEGTVKLGLDSIAKNCMNKEIDLPRNSSDTTMRPSVFTDIFTDKPLDEDRDPLYIGPEEFSVDSREDRKSTTIIKEEVDLDTCESSEEEVLFVDPVKTEVRDLSSNPENLVNGEDERIQINLANLKLRNDLYRKHRDKVKQENINSNLMMFSGSENRYNPTVKEIMKSILNDNDTEIEELRRNWGKFRGKIYQSRYRARINGRLNLETEKMLQMKVERYMARMFLDYEEILNNKRLNIRPPQQFSSEDLSQSRMHSDDSNSAITPTEEEDSESYIIGI